MSARSYDAANPKTLPCNQLANAKRRTARARQFMVNTCPASRHVHMMALRLAQGNPCMLQDDPEHCAGSLLSVLESLWKLRTQAKKAGLPWA